MRGIELLERGDQAREYAVQATSSTTGRLRSGRSLRTISIRALDTPPNPARVRRELQAMDDEALLYVVPRLTGSLRDAALADHRLIVAAVDDQTLVIDGVEHAGPGPGSPPARVSRGRKPWGRYALVRALLRTSAPRTQTELGAETGISQQAVALALAALGPLGVERGPRGWTSSDPGLLWDRFLAEYPGPGGIRRRWTSVASLSAQHERAVATARSADLPVLVSGDTAADVQAPMRRPVTVVLYAEADLDLSSRFAPASAGDETLAVVVPADPTVFATARAWSPGSTPTTTDPLVTAWEVAHGRGADREDAVDALRRVTLDERGRR